MLFLSSMFEANIFTIFNFRLFLLVKRPCGELSLLADTDGEFDMISLQYRS